MNVNDDLIVEYTVKVTECPCGSGKSPEKCCGPVKPRRYVAILDPRNYTESDGLAIGLDRSLKRIVNGELKPLIGEPQFTQSYTRDKSDRLLVQGPQDRHWAMHPDGILLNYDHIFVIDTNSSEMHDHIVSISCVIHAYKDNVNDSDYIFYSPLAFFEFWDPVINSEKLGWFTLITAIQDNNEFSDKKIGIVVDSFQSDLAPYNNRNKPYLNEHFLPTNIKFIYATDKGINIANKLMRLCDRQASDILSWRKENPDPSSLHDSTDYPCKKFRQLIPNQDSQTWKIHGSKTMPREAKRERK